MHPAGVLGRAFGVVMETLNGPAYRAALRALAPKPDQYILEIGFGTGRFAELVLGIDPTSHVAGVDPTATMVETANRRRGVRAAGPRADLRQGDASSLPWPEGQFDAVVAIHSFQFWPNPDQTLKEIGRVLAPTGRLLLLLRKHRGAGPAWLPNPLSRSGRELLATQDLLAGKGFTVNHYPDGGSSAVLLATRPTVP
jgi:ubiquinone/menaquinone biosynthesis C-methylase UbiE